MTGIKKYKADDRVGQLKLSIALELLPKLPPISCKKNYRLIVIDPPWEFSLRERDKTHRGRCSYPSMTDEQILNMPQQSVVTIPTYYCG